MRSGLEPNLGFVSIRVKNAPPPPPALVTRNTNARRLKELYLALLYFSPRFDCWRTTVSCRGLRDGGAAGCRPSDFFADRHSSTSCGLLLDRRRHSVGVPAETREIGDVIKSYKSRITSARPDQKELLKGIEKRVA